jgi:hypothetical protein
MLHNWNLVCSETQILNTLETLTLSHSISLNTDLIDWLSWCFLNDSPHSVTVDVVITFLGGPGFKCPSSFTLPMLNIWIWLWIRQHCVVCIIFLLHIMYNCRMFMFAIQFYNFSFLLQVIVHFENTWNYDINYDVISDFIVWFFSQYFAIS